MQIVKQLNLKTNLKLLHKCVHFIEEYEAYMKTLDVTYKTEVTTTVEPKVGDLPPAVSEYDMQRKMAQQVFITEKVKKHRTKFLPAYYSTKVN